MVIGLLLLSGMSPASAITGEKYVNLQPPLRLAFVAGVLDGWEKVLGRERRS